MELFLTVRQLNYNFFTSDVYLTVSYGRVFYGLNSKIATFSETVKLQKFNAGARPVMLAVESQCPLNPTAAYFDLFGPVWAFLSAWQLISGPIRRILAQSGLFEESL
jgi:hypothetical protein